MKTISDKCKSNITQILRWAVFVMASITMSIKIAEAASNKTLALIIANPEIAEFSTLVNTGYLFFI